MAASVQDFERDRQTYVKVVEDVLQTNGDFRNKLNSNGAQKISLDQAFKDVLIRLLERDAGCDIYKKLINHSCDAVAQDLCAPTTPFILLSDLMDCITLDKCEAMFQLVDEKVNLWKSEMFYNSGKNYLLRMCNDNLKRLSKSQNTVFCGKIQQFLAKLFPLSEKSGLNLMSEFNLVNVTHFVTQAEDYDRSRKQSLDTEHEKEAKMDMEEGEADETEETSSIPIDYNLYRKFWSLQDYFRKPAQCFEKAQWKAFSNHADEVLSCFESFKLDDTKLSRRKLPTSQDMETETDTKGYFAKYLTSEKLLDLQLSDSNFRRYVLTQFLVLFHYLNAPVKFKTNTQSLNDDQATWVKTTTERILAILNETPPEGADFKTCLQHILSRENNWNSWKNEGCPSFVKEKAGAPLKFQDRKGKKRSMGDDIKAAGGKFVKMGNSELTRLWNLFPDNMEACKAKPKSTVPTPEEFFEDAIEQNDPEQMVDDEYKLVLNTTFQWKSLRLLSRKSPHFFTQTIHPEKNLREYLEKVCNKISKEMPTTQDDCKTELEEEHDDKDEQNHEEENIDRTEEAKEDEEEEEVVLVTEEQLNQIAQLLGANWKALAMELNLEEDQITAIEKDSEDVIEQAMTMLGRWKDNESDRATPGTLQTALQEIGQSSVATQVFSENS